MQYLLNKKLQINGRQIACRVTANPEQQSNHFILMIPGGPGFRSSVFDAHVEKLTKAAQDHGQEPPHFILYDPLGCGDSDPADNPDEEYTFSNFTEIAAQVVEQVKAELDINDLKLDVIGHSFGGMIAVNLPTQRPQWTDPNAAIKLNTIISSSTPNSLNEGNAIFFLKEHYADHPDYEAMRIGIERIFEGNLLNQEDYIRTIVFVLARLYADKNEQLLQGFWGKIIQAFPMQVIRVLQWVNKILNLDQINYILVALTGFNVSVMNHFFQSNDGSFDLEQIIKHNANLYRKVKLFCIGGTRDYIAQSDKNAAVLHEIMPEHIGLVEFDSKHSISIESPELYIKLLNHLLTGGILYEGDLDDTNCEHPIVTCSPANLFYRTTAERELLKLLRDNKDKIPGIMEELERQPAKVPARVDAVYVEDFDEEKSDSYSNGM